MLQQVTIQTEDRKTLKPLHQSAIDAEKKVVMPGLEHTRNRLVEFENIYPMSSVEFERRLLACHIDETVDFLEILNEIEKIYLANLL